MSLGEETEVSSELTIGWAAQYMYPGAGVGLTTDAKTN